MNIAVFSDKFSGTLSAIEVLDIVKNKFVESKVNADYFSITDGGQESTEIFKSYDFKIHESFKTLNCDNSLSTVESVASIVTDSGVSFLVCPRRTCLGRSR